MVKEPWERFVSDGSDYTIISSKPKQKVQGKFTQKEATYLQTSKSESRRCETCVFFKETGECLIVENKPLEIVAEGICTQYAEKTYIETKIYEDDPDEEKIQTRIDKELKSYRSYEMKHFKNKKREFEPKVVPAYVHHALIDALDNCKSYDAISQVFASIWSDPIIKSISTYQRALRELGTGVWRGEISEGDFTVRTESEIDRSLTEAFFAGVKDGGLEREDLTAKELKELDKVIEQEQFHVSDLAGFIEANSKQNGGRLNVIRSRVDRWISRYDNVKNAGFLIASRNKSMMWLFDSRKEHCGDCAKLHKRIYKASIWLKNNIRPQSNLLACFGLWCGCRFVETDQAVNRGRPPKLVGPK